MTSKIISLILGGGVGSRLYPLTQDRSKPAVPIAGKYRLIDIPISNCLNSGIKQMFVLTQFNSASLNQHIKNTYHFDLFNAGFVDILAAEQTPSSDKWFQGTADAVKQSMHHLQSYDYEYVLILSGDHLYQMDFNEMIKEHLDNKADITIATIPCAKKEASSFGIMKVDGESKITKFIEKPSMDLLPNWKSEVSDENEQLGKNYLASMGIYLFSKKVLTELFEQHPEDVDFGKEIIPKAILSGHKVQSFQYEDYWTDIGTIRSFYEANIALTKANANFDLFDKRHFVYTHPRMLAPSKIFGTKISESLISEGCSLKANEIQQSVVGIRTKIGRYSIVKNSILLGNDFYESNKDKEAVPLGIGKNCFIKNAIIDKNCRIGDNVTIRGEATLFDVETETYCIKDGLVIIKKGAVIPNGTYIGDTSMMTGKVKVGDYLIPS